MYFIELLPKSDYVKQAKALESALRKLASEGVPKRATEKELSSRTRAEQVKYYVSRLVDLAAPQLPRSPVPWLQQAAGEQEDRPLYLGDRLLQGCDNQL